VNPASRVPVEFTIMERRRLAFRGASRDSTEAAVRYGGFYFSAL